MSLGKVAIALSGGGALGLAHVGALKVFEENDITPKFVSGTSAGSIVGALYASGMSVAEIEKIVLSVDRKKTFQLLAPSLPRGGIIEPNEFVAFMEDIVGKDTMIEDLALPFVAVAVDFRNGNILYLDRGRVVDAIRASISIPGVFKPMEANGTLLVDGGLRENLPLSALKNFNYDTLIGVNVLKTTELKLDGIFTPISAKNKYEKDEPDNFFERIVEALQMRISNRLNHLPRLTYVGYQSILIMMTELSNKEIQICNPDLVLHLNLSKIQPWEFWRGKEAIEIGYRESTEQLQEFLNN
jgi:NTE family protein